MRKNDSLKERLHEIIFEADTRAGKLFAIVTLTTVGFGDITPHTAIGQFLASLVMIMGYGIIAVPTGIVSAEMAAAHRQQNTTQACRHCSLDGHDDDAVYCKYCGWKLNEDSDAP